MTRYDERLYIYIYINTITSYDVSLLSTRESSDRWNSVSSHFQIQRRARIIEKTRPHRRVFPICPPITVWNSWIFIAPFSSKRGFTTLHHFLRVRQDETSESTLRPRVSSARVRWSSRKVSNPPGALDSRLEISCLLFSPLLPLFCSREQKDRTQFPI